MSAKRKQGRRTIREVGSVAPRAVRAESPAAGGPAYPTAVELVASGEAWRAWLDDALRRVLAPVALAGAIGVAAAGCGTSGSALEAFGASPLASSSPDSPQPLSPFAPTVVSPKPSIGGPTATLAPLGPPSTPQPLPPAVVRPPQPPARPLPPPRQPPPPLDPNPPMVRGQMVAVPPQLPPRPPVRPVVQPQPIRHPIAMGGGARPAYFAPPQPVAPVIVPRPDPPSVDGEMQAVEP